MLKAYRRRLVYGCVFQGRLMPWLFAPMSVMLYVGPPPKET